MTSSNSTGALGEEDPIREGQFRIHPKNTTYNVGLFINELRCIPMKNGNTQKKSLLFSYSDVIGCHCMRGRGEENSTNAYFCLYTYPNKKKVFGGARVRKRRDISFVVDVKNSYEENLRVAEEWRVAILACLKRAMDVDIPPQTRKVLVFVNPFSGPGKALEIYQKRVVPTLAELDLNFQLIITERAGHAKETVKTININEWYGIIIVSGDGLIYEVINGLMSRPDWEQAIHHLPLGVVPGGSGNALCCVINHHNGEPYKDNILTHSLFVLAKHKVKALDLVAVDTVEGRQYSFLSITWGIFSDVDIESEKYRSLGNARFTVGALVRIVGLRTYHGRLSFLPCEPYRPVTSRSISVSTWNPTVNANSADVITSQPKSRSLSCPDGIGDSDAEHVLRNRLQRGGPSEESVIPISPREDDEGGGGGGDLETVTANSNAQSSSDGLQPDCDRESGGDSATPTPRPVETSLLPSLSDPVPSSWVSIEDNFVTVVAAYESHLGPDIIIAPDATFDDGVIHLMFAKAGISRSSLLKLFLAMEDGSHINSPDVEIVKVKAFRLEPLTPGGVIAIDGEKIKYGPIQAQVLPGLARFMA